METPRINQKITIPIHGLGSSGEGVGYYEGYTVFVNDALPGEIVEVRLFQAQKRFGRGNLISIIKSSPDRVVPPCPLFGRCGGCQLMHLAYPKQLEIKRQRVVDALTRIAKMTDVTVEPCMASPSSLEYRNKIQLPVRQGMNDIAIGLFAKSSHELVEVDHCYIHCALGEDVYKDVRAIIKRSQLIPYDLRTGTGELRHVLIKSAVNTHEVLVVLVTNGNASETLKHVAKEIISTCASKVKGVLQNINTEQDNVILGREYNLLEGVGSITETLCGLNFKVSPASFFQVNPQQAERLYTKALEFAELKGDEKVLDAYCGVGTLSLFFAKHAKKVIGVECVPEAIRDAKENASLNHITNSSFMCANAEAYIGSLSDVDVIILNPPRKGCEPAFLEGIGRLLPQKVVYISCDPATLARDLAHLKTFGYETKAVQPYDMFPQTAHVECVVQLILNNSR